MTNSMIQGGLTTTEIQKSIQTGAWKPNIYLTNISVAQLQEQNDFGASKIFPIVPVSLATSSYYKFSKEDLARTNMQEKPRFGMVEPTQWAQDTDNYSVKVYQSIYGVDTISANAYGRVGTPGISDPLVARARLAAEQTNLLFDLKFADTYFKAGVWANEYAGKTTTPGTKEFYQFDNANSDPVVFFDSLITEMVREGRKKPNKLSLGANTFDALKNNPSVKERVKYGGSTSNPAIVNTKVLAELFGVDEVVVLRSTINKAAEGQAVDMQYIFDPNGALLSYSPTAPAIDEPSAGYIFTWDVLGNGQPMAITSFNGQPGTHSEFVEALCAFDMKQVSSDLATYLTDCTSK